MADFPELQYSKNEVRRAGRLLAGSILWKPEAEPDVIRVFKIANNWRETHAFPMKSLRHELIAKLLQNNLSGVTAARLKRMPSIRRKLRTISDLTKIQDLGGVRIIFTTMDEVKAAINVARDCSSHIIEWEKDYINLPKRGGYRCHHLVFSFRGNDRRDPLSGRRIEIQIRSRLQHSWATAVEAVGLYRQENMKAGEGNNSWLRLFELMSAELALAEGCPEGEFQPNRKSRMREIFEINREIKAIDQLDKLRLAFQHTEQPRIIKEKPKYFRIQFDHGRNSVLVTDHYSIEPALLDYATAEARSGGNADIDTVIVEVDKLEDLKAAYPNYFGDVKLFTDALRSVTQGQTAKEPTLPPRLYRPPPPLPVGDTSWFKPPRSRRWK